VRILQPVGEDEVIATFLRAELDSERYGDKLRGLLARNQRDESVLRQPDFASSTDNAYRRALLDEHRAYERREGLFQGFPRQVDWHRAIFTREELLEIRYINWDWWLRITGGSRRAADAAARIRAGEVPGVFVAEEEPIAAGLGAPGAPELIAATIPALSPVVLIEGHVRLTAAALFPELVPDELELLLGISPEMENWSEF
jgi:hypothetical protein